MAVNIQIDLKAGQAKEKLAELKTEMKALEDDLDLDLGVDSELGDTIDDITDSLEEASEAFNKNIDEAVDRLEELDLDEMKVMEVQQGGGDSGGGTGSDSGDGDGTPSKFLGGSGRKSRRSDVYNKRFGNRLKDIIDDVQDRASINREDSWFNRDRMHTESRVSGFQKRMRNKDRRTRGTAAGLNIPDVDLAGFRQKNAKFADGFKPDRLHGIRDAFKRINRGVSRLIPSMNTFYTLIAVLAPMIITMAGALIGMAAAMSAVAVAGAAVIGLGLVGHGDDLSEAFGNAKEQVVDFGKNLFEAFQPAAEVLAPIQEAFMDWAPTQVDGLVDEIEKFASFGDGIFSVWTTLIDGLESFFAVINRNEAAVRDLSSTFSNIIGTNLLQFFEWSIQMLDQNQDMFIQLGKMIKVAMGAVWDLSLAISYMAIHFGWLLDIGAALAEVLNTTVGTSILTVVAGLYLAVKAGMAFMAVLTTLNALTSTALVGGLIKAFTALQAYTFKMVAATGATYGLAHAVSTLMATTGIGLLALGGGLIASKAINAKMGGNEGPRDAKPRPTSSSGGGKIVNNETNNYNVNVEGDMDTASRERVVDEISKDKKSTAKRNQDINKPGPDATE